jgi:hypothetical protein
MRRTARMLPNGAFNAPLSPLQRAVISTFRSRPYINQPLLSVRPFSSSRAWSNENSTAKAKAPNGRDQETHEQQAFNTQIDNAVGEAKELQTRTPWHREGTDKPPVKRQRSAGAMTKGLSLPYYSTSREDIAKGLCMNGQANCSLRPRNY